MDLYACLWALPSRQHLFGLAEIAPGKIFKKGAKEKLWPDLYKHIARFRSRDVAAAMESLVPQELNDAGYIVEGVKVK